MKCQDPLFALVSYSEVERKVHADGPYKHEASPPRFRFVSSSPSYLDYDRPDCALLTIFKGPRGHLCAHDLSVYCFRSGCRRLNGVGRPNNSVSGLPLLMAIGGEHTDLVSPFCLNIYKTKMKAFAAEYLTASGRVSAM